MFGKMCSIPLSDIGLSLQHLNELDESKIAKYIAKLQELITTTNAKLIVLPSVMSLLNIMSFFNDLNKGDHLFWKRAFTLLENELKKEKNLDENESI